MRSRGLARLALQLIDHAARRAPPELSERLAEEWRADLAAQSGSFARLRFALGCLWAREIISGNPMEFGASVAGHGTLAAFAPQDSTFYSRRTGVLVLIAGLHLLVFYGFSAGITTRILDALPAPLKGSFVETMPTPRQTPPPPRVQFEHWTPVGPVIDTSFRLPPDAGLSGDVYHLPSSTGPLVSAPPVVRVSGGIGSGFPSADDFYPASAIRLGEAGAVAVKVCVDPRGRLVGDPAIVDSSGNAKLDAGAIALARAGSGHYRATTEDGKAVTACFPFRVRFAIKG